ncbi:MAG: ABC transporter substrate binding protein, partial [Candidatus Competibacteraceae bacterium]|nr:ABC transporter substrate binding protein [Candidatus Competibacteraceae bacterium]
MTGFLMQIRLTGLLWLCTTIVSVQADESPRLQILLSKDTAVFQDFYQTFAPAAQKTLGAHLELLEDVPSSTAPLPTLTLAVGTFACLDLLAQASTRPVLCTLTPRLAILDALKAYAGPATALYIDQPIDRHLTLIQQALPDTRTLGFIAGPVSEREVAALANATQQRGWRLLNVNYTGEQNIIATLQPLLDGADVVLALPDPAVYSKMHIYSVLLALYRKTIPLFGFSSAFVDAGALTAVFSTPEQIAQQTVELTARWLNDPGQAPPPPEYPRYYSVRVNRGVVK